MVKDADVYKKDAQLSKLLHGKDATAKYGLSAMTGKDKETAALQNKRWFDHFKGVDAVRVGAKDTGLSAHEGNAVKMTQAYYDLATDLYEYGWSQSFHFCRYYPGEAFHQALARHEYYLASKIGISEGMNVLDVGCGVGGPARAIAQFTGANIIGLNNSDYQIQRAAHYTAKNSLSNQVTYVKGDFMHMDFGAGRFDAVYAIEATVHAPSLKGVYGEIYKVLKPGGIFGVYEWLLTDKYDDTNENHRQIRRGIEFGNGISRMVGVDVADKALSDVGFELLHREDLAQRGDSVPWYYALTGDLKQVRTPWDFLTVLRISKVGRVVTQMALGLLERIHIVPQGTQEVGHALEIAADCLVAGAREEIFTPMMLYICQKPLIPANGN